MLVHIRLLALQDIETLQHFDDDILQSENSLSQQPWLENRAGLTEHFVKLFTPDINLVCLPIFTGISFSLNLSLLTGDLSEFIFKSNFLPGPGCLSCLLKYKIKY